MPPDCQARFGRRRAQIVTWDDHEVDNDYAADHQENGHPRDKFIERRASGYQAYYEHMPLRLAQKHNGLALQLYRTVRYGKLAAFQVLDTRQYRDPQPYGGGGFTGPCPDAANGDILGGAQTKWLLARLGRAPSRGRPSCRVSIRRRCPRGSN